MSYLFSDFMCFANNSHFIQLQSQSFCLLQILSNSISVISFRFNYLRFLSNAHPCHIIREWRNNHQV